ncbi:DUF4133 domain-containing protein [uncultured Chryseobacterium sp.]|uniref:DUF4133 domain-containing protein n=1 Tax=uncultured Chryseobacterium sp. TaxID=259322 RepID=UPI0025E8A957|nr:DUF4133 domain-containing protein [uncultured Chryseobacterium sp.]
MKNYHINKGIGRTVEFKGLKAQYLFIFAGGLLAILVSVMILYMAGVNAYLCLILGGASSGLLIWQTFRLNGKYGEHGIMKTVARRKHPDYIICRKCIYRYLKINRKRADV